MPLLRPNPITIMNLQISSPILSRIVYPGSSRLALVVELGDGQATVVVPFDASLLVRRAEIVSEVDADGDIRRVLDLTVFESQIYQEYELSGDSRTSEIDELAEWARDIAVHPWAHIHVVRLGPQANFYDPQSGKIT